MDAFDVAVGALWIVLGAGMIASRHRLTRDSGRSAAEGRGWLGAPRTFVALGLLWIALGTAKLVTG